MPSNRKKLALIPAALLLVMALLTLKPGIGDIQAYPVRYAIKLWQAENRLPTEDQLAKAQSAISTALNWQPDNPEYNDYQGRLYHYRAVLSQDQSEQNKALTKALQSYRTSTSLRPHWPYSWANLALIKALLQQYDAEYEQALAKAINTGPWENAVNIALTEAGLLGWLTLNQERRQQIVDNIQRGIRRNQPQIKAVVDRYNKRPLVCAYLNRDKYQKKFCGF